MMKIFIISLIILFSLCLSTKIKNQKLLNLYNLSNECKLKYFTSQIEINFILSNFKFINKELKDEKINDIVNKIPKFCNIKQYISTTEENKNYKLLFLNNTSTLRDSIIINKTEINKATIFSFVNLVWIASIFFIIIPITILVGTRVNLGKNVELINYLSVFIFLIGGKYLNESIAVYFGLFGCILYLESYYLCFHLHKNHEFFKNKFPWKLLINSSIVIFSGASFSYKSQLIGILAIVAIQAKIYVEVIKQVQFQRNVDMDKTLINAIVCSFLLIASYIILRFALEIVSMEFVNLTLVNLETGIMINAGLIYFSGLSIFAIGNSPKVIIATVDFNYNTKILADWIQQFPQFAYFFSIGFVLFFGSFINSLGILKGVATFSLILYVYFMYFYYTKGKENSLLVIAVGFGILLFITSLLLNQFSFIFFNFNHA